MTLPLLVVEHNNVSSFVFSANGKICYKQKSCFDVNVKNFLQYNRYFYRIFCGLEKSIKGKCYRKIEVISRFW